MKWLELSVECPPEFVEPVSAMFHRYGDGGVAVEEPGGFNPDEGERQQPPDRVTVKTYVRLDSCTADRRGHIDVGIRLLAVIGPVSCLRERLLEEEEWEYAWREHFHVLRIGRRIRVVPTWREYRPRTGDVVIELDPGLAFGTGHHPTTRMCLELLEELVRPGMDVLDVGCGSGILSIAAAKLGARSVLGLDIDAAAVEVARSNAAMNRVGRTIRVEHGTLPDAGSPTRQYDMVVANISAKVISGLAEELVSVARPGGTMVVSGVLAENEEGVATRLVEAGAQLQRTNEVGGWACLVARTDRPPRDGGPVLGGPVRCRT